MPWRGRGRAGTHTELEERIAIFAIRQDVVALGVLFEVLADGPLCVFGVVVVEERSVHAVEQRKVLLKPDGHLEQSGGVGVVGAPLGIAAAADGRQPEGVQDLVDLRRVAQLEPLLELGARGEG